MSYDISLLNPETKKPAEVIRFHEGGTQPLGGSTEATLNVTYNYSDKFSFRDLNNKKASNTIKIMEEAVKKYGTETSENYWDSTPGNVGYAIFILLGWAKQYPDYIWEVV